MSNNQPVDRVREGLMHSESAQSLMLPIPLILFIGTMALSSWHHSWSAESGSKLNILDVSFGFGIAMLIALPFGLLALRAWRKVLRFRRDNPAAYEEGQDKIGRLSFRDRFIWNTDASGDPIKRDRKK